MSDQKNSPIFQRSNSPPRGSVVCFVESFPAYPCHCSLNIFLQLLSIVANEIFLIQLQLKKYSEAVQFARDMTERGSKSNLILLLQAAPPSRISPAAFAQIDDLGLAKLE